MVRVCKVTLLASLLIIAGCPSDDSNGSSGNIKVSPEMGNDDPVDAGNNQSGDDNNTNNVRVDMGGDDTGPDMRVDAPGFMHGEWEVQRASDEATLATLNLRHEDGETTVSGTYRMQEPEPLFGQLGGSNWQNGRFTTSWTVEIDNTNEQFGLANCTPDDGDDVLACRYSSSFDGTVIDANLMRQP